MNLPGAGSFVEGLRRAFVHDIGLKLIALLASVVLFSIVHGAEDAQKSIYVDLITILPSDESGRMLISEPPVRVRVTLTGSRSQLNAIRQEQLPPVQIDLRDHEGGEYYFADEDLDLPVGVEIQQWAPASIPLEYAIRSERTLPVEPIFAGEPRDGLRLADELEVEPTRVMMVGPEAEVESFERVATSPIDLLRYGVGQHTVRVRLSRPPEHTSYPTTTSVSVTFRILSETRRRLLEDVELSVVGGQVQQLRPPRVDVELSGAPGLIETIDPDHVVPYVDIEDLEPSEGAQPRAVRMRGLPDGVTAAAIQPEEVLVSKAP